MWLDIHPKLWQQQSIITTKYEYCSAHSRSHACDDYDDMYPLGSHSAWHNYHAQAVQHNGITQQNIA